MVGLDVAKGESQVQAFLDKKKPYKKRGIQLLNLLNLRNLSRQHNRIQKVLEGANIKLGSVVSDIMGVSTGDLLNAIAECEENSEKLANFARRTMKKKKDELELALKG
ncbi:hypothetical protein [Peribacillus sp. FSL R5-0717]|uniref:hypothetical protein n=1 Tax=Peribacillus sp. FSL R5-0717 TaxID=2975308 RepID=UPI0030F82584